MVNTLLPETRGTHDFIVEDVTDSWPAHQRGNLDKLLEVGPAGIAELDEETGSWWVW